MADKKSISAQKAGRVSGNDQQVKMVKANTPPVVLYLLFLTPIYITERIQIKNIIRLGQ